MQNKAFKALSECTCVSLITACVIPGFLLLGNLFSQVLASMVSTIFILVIFDLVFKIKPYIFARSLCFMTLFWVIIALIKQALLHIKTSEFDFNWFHLFYYDKPAMLFVVQFTCILYFIIKLIIKRNDNQFINDYSVFIKRTTICLVLYYILILVYCFILVRTITFIKPTPNLIPFDTIISSFSGARIDYELLFLFLGNIAIFIPLGLLIAALTKNNLILILLPFMLSIGIEVSQYYLGNGHPDIDDVMLNVSGFYIGVAFKKITDNILYKVSVGKIDSFFIFSKRDS